MKLDVSLQELKVLYGILEKAEDTYPGIIAEISGAKKSNNFEDEDSESFDEDEDFQVMHESTEQPQSSSWLSVARNVKQICDLD